MTSSDEFIVPLKVIKFISWHPPNAGYSWSSLGCSKACEILMTVFLYVPTISFVWFEYL